MELRIGRKYRLGRKIGSGSFGEIYIGTDTQTNEEVAIKLESVKTPHPQLSHESKIYSILHLQGGGMIPNMRWYGVEMDQYNVLVMDLLGPSLEELFSHCDKRGQLLLWLSPPSEFSVLRPQLAPLVVMVVKCFDAPTLASRHD
ncbi:unnamed protein product [Brassica rapa subsp. narinosa]|uniref:Protein kinase domain-containing protein n=1 Tax=Brassica campestris TaxID=3711 RepID=M4CZ79_BRACM